MTPFSSPKQIYFCGCILCIIFLAGCNNSGSNLPAHIRNIENLKLIDPESHFPSEFHFKREVTYEDSLHIDRVTDLRTDENGRLYMASESWGRRQVHIFEDDGTYIDSLGRFGTGPGEFQSMDHLQIRNGTLYLFDEKLQRITTYDTSENERIDTLSFSQDSLPFPEELSLNAFRLSPVAKLDEHSYLVSFRQKRNPAYEPEGLILFYILETDSEITWTKLAEMPDITWLVGDYAGSPSAFTLPTPEKSLFYLTESRRFITAHTSEFFIKSMDLEGGIQRAYYIPVERIPLNPSELNHPRFSHNDQVLRVRESAVYPDYWPVLFSILADNRNRIWIATITENRDWLKWWVFDDDTGELITRFSWPFERPIMHVKNSSVYTVEKDEMGFERVVRYRLEEEQNHFESVQPEFRMPVSDEQKP